MKLKTVDINKVTPMMKQYIDIKNENIDNILFYRLGDFYEMFFEDAIICSKELELTLTKKSAGLEEKIPMCGVPFHSAPTYIDKLIDKGYKVAIAEQLEDAKETKGLVKRGVIQVVSSGTTLSQTTLKETENNYIGAIQDFITYYTLTYCDITTGEIYAMIINKDESKLINKILSKNLKEIIVYTDFNNKIITVLKENYNIVISYLETMKTIEEYEYIYESIEDLSIKKSIQYLLTYINNTQLRIMNHFKEVKIEQESQILRMDIHTKRNLEITETLRLKSRTHSLIWLLDKTKTAMGARLLKTYIENPLTCKEKIEKKYDQVEILKHEFIKTSELITYLDKVYDLERLVGRISFGNANARDLLMLKNSIQVLPSINQILTQLNFEPINTLENLYKLLNDSIYQEPPISLKEGYLIKEGYNEELDDLKKLRKGGKDFIAKFEIEEKEKTNIKNLKIGYNRIFGYYIEISKGNTHLVKEEYGYERKQTLANCERYISKILKEKEDLILNAEEKIINIEYNLFNQIKDQVKIYIKQLQATSTKLAKIDCLQSFAIIASDYNLIRPTLNNDKHLKLIESRHPVVEQVLKNTEFVNNDIVMEKDTNILLITGPNMAGKSTYMRQLAIIVIMAQIGCYVPAQIAEMPVFDAIYTRIGASDDLVSGESTFMVEMIEANNAIQNATENSLILFDELGRGTATFDGMSLAQAIIEHIHDKIKCKTIFSTHYHELTDLKKNNQKLKNIHVSAYEENGNITFLHKIKEGSIDKSYGIHVAKIANLPDSVIIRATEILNIYENKDQKRDITINKIKEQPAPYNKVNNILQTIEPLNITPLEALNILIELKKHI